MRLNSVIMVLLAIVFGVGAVILANLYLDNQIDLLARNSDEGPDNTIVVASTGLRFGDTLGRDNLREIPWPANAMPQGAFKTRDELLGDEGTRQALTSISPNEPILATKITGAGQRATLSAVLTEGMRAVSIRVNDVLGVAGFVLPGDRVDILLTRNSTDGTGAAVDVLLQSIKVLAVDQFSDEERNSATVVKAVTLEVNTKDAQKLTLAARVGQLSLALRQVASSEGEVTDRITMQDLTGDTPADVAARQAELERLKAEEDARRRAEEQIAGIQKAVENVGSRLETRIGSVEEQLNQVKNQPAPQDPEVREVVREVVKIVAPPKPKRSSVRVYRNLNPETYDVPTVVEE